MGPIHKADSRQAVVRRMLDLLEEAKGKKCDLVVYPELALTTFFPRWYMTDQAEVDAWFEREMPNAATRPLFEQAADYRIGLSFGYAELTPDGHHFNTSILVDRNGKSWASITRCICPGIRNTIRSAPSNTWKSVISNRATSVFRSGALWAVSSACVSAMIGDGPRPIASWACKAWS